MVKYRPHLLDSDAREPLYKLSYLDAIFQVFKESGYRYARTEKHPAAANTPWVTLDRRTG